jgi:hypothetical protein
MAWAVWRTWLQEQPRVDLVISTGTEGGTYIVLGEQLARILEDYEGEEIESVTAIESAGSVENIERLVDGEAQLAFVIAPVLARDPHHDQIRVLLSLYTDRLQVVVRKDASIRRLVDLAGKRIYIGKDGSGTKIIATEILRTFGISKGDYSRVGPDSSFDRASLLLQRNQADAAFFVASTPAKAVSDALGSRECECIILDLKHDADRIAEGKPGGELDLAVREIPALIYENQAERVRTVGAKALLVSLATLDKEVVIEIEDALFDNVGALAEAHIQAHDIRLDRAFKIPKGLKIHPGSLKFQDQEQKRLLIATGTINGKYYQVGKQIQLALRQNGIPARAMQTDGSMENLKLLAAARRPTIAIVQYDTALASHWSPTIYHTSRTSDVVEIDRVKSLRRIATLHEEKIHVLIRRDKFPKAGERPTISLLEGKNVCVGPEHSGTRLLAEAILRHHGIEYNRLYLSVPDMVDRIRGGEIHAGFFVSHVPSEALKTLVHDPKNRLLAIDPRKMGGLLGSAIGLSKIESGTYGAQHDGEPAIETVATWAVLVTRDDLTFDVESITRAVFGGAAFLGIAATEKGMARDLSSLPLHRDARQYYEKAGLLPAPIPPDWLGATWRSLTILAILAAAYQGLLTTRREATRRWFGRRISKIRIESDYASSATDLLMVLEEVRNCGRMPPWKKQQLDQSRVLALETRIDQQVEQARQNANQSLLAKLRLLRATSEMDEKSLLEGYASQEDAVWLHLENGEIDPSQARLLLDIIRDRRGEIEDRH